MVSEKIVITDPLGLHLRPAGAICTVAINFQSKIKLHKENVTVNAKSVLSLLGACVKNGEEIEIICEGEDEKEALQAVLAVIKQ